MNSVRDECGTPVTGGHDLENVSSLSRFMKRVLYGLELPYELRWRNGREIIHGTPWAKDFQSLDVFAHLYADDLHFSPLLNLFFQVYRRHPIRLWVADGRIRGGKDATLPARMRMCNHFVTCMRKRAIRLKLKAKISDWQRNIKKNQERLFRYIPALYEESSRLVFVRLDLLYRKNLKPRAEIDKILDERPFTVGVQQDRYFNLFPSRQSNEVGQGQRLALQRNQPVQLGLLGDASSSQMVSRPSINEVLGDRERLMTNLRSKPSLFSKLVGYVIRIEFTRDAGYHLHAAFIFKEAKHHAYLGTQIGKYWEEVITRGRGYHFNCNREDYRCFAVGPIDAHESEKREKLMEVLCYLAKRDQYVHVKPSKGAKMFTTGQFPKKRPKKLGRPRINRLKPAGKVNKDAQIATSDIVLGQQGRGFARSGSNWGTAGVEKITGWAK